MAYLLVSVLFAPIIFFALRKKKWYLYLMVAFIAILPEQFSISLHDKLPLLSASRILIVIAAAFWFFQRLKERNFKPPVSILVFLVINLAISVFHLFSDFDEINRIFLLIAERGLVVVILVDLISSREEFDCCVDFLILGCCSIAVIGICQTIFDYDIAAVLHLKETFTSAMVSDRMGLTRAFATKNAISYGCYCAFMVLPIYYRLQATRKQRYSVAFALNFVALIATFTRSAWLCIASILALVFLTRPMKMLRSLWPSLILIVALCLGFNLIQPRFGAALTETAKSSLNTVIAALPDEWFAHEGAATTEPTATVPTEPTATVSTEPTATVPTEPTATVPTEPTATVSTEPIVTVPTEPTVTVSTEPTVTVPAEPTVAVPAEPTKPENPKKPTFELSEDFGLNANNPTYSRLFQWSAVKYMLQDGNFLLGYGYNAFLQGQIYFTHKNWGTEYVVAPVLDVGLVSIFVESGFIGMLSYLGLLGYMLLQSIRKRDHSGAFDFYKAMIFMIPLYLLLNFLSAFTNVALVWLVFGLFHAYENLDKKGFLAESPTLSSKKWQF